MQLHEFIKYGAVGLSAILCILIFYLLQKQHTLQTQFNINKSVNKGFTKMLYCFAGMCVFLSVLGYGSELLHDYLTKKDLGKELAIAEEKIEKLNERVVAAEKEAAVNKAILDLIREENGKRLLENGGRVVKSLPNPAVAAAVLAPKKKCPYPKPEPKMNRNPDAVFKYNTALILAGKKPLSEKDYLSASLQNQFEWMEWQSKMKLWLKDNPDQKVYYPEVFE